MAFRTWVFSALAVFFLVLLAWAWEVHKAEQSVVANVADEVFEIAKGESLGQIASRLHRRGILEHPRRFMALAYWRRESLQLKFGEYLVRPGTRLGELLRQFVAGKVIQHAFAIIEGWNIRQVLAALGGHPKLDRRLIEHRPQDILRALGYPDGSAEGRLFPDTYYFPKGFRDTELLRRAVERMNAVLAWEWQHRQPGLPLQSAYDALILASIIEKETARDDERALIAGVFVRRLERRMRLQTDPTVIYGLAERYTGNITRQDLLQDTPYNTYTRAGLPPTPIAMPGPASLHAAVHPEPGTSLYFVARGDGSHVFSSSLQEHERAVTEFQRKRHD
jgi:UPF0755 protein